MISRHYLLTGDVLHGMDDPLDLYVRGKRFDLVYLHKGLYTV